MKKNNVYSLKTLLFPALLAICSPALSQGLPGTNDDGFSVDIRTPVSIAQYIPHYNKAKPGACYWVGSTYGPSLGQDVCGEVAWAYDETPDSLGCDPIPGNLAGKIALIRRGMCNFSLKVYRAQQAGAIAVIILNHFDSAADGPCISYSFGVQFTGMPGGDSAHAVKIPSVFLQRETGAQLSEALRNGEKVEVCFRLPRVQNAAIAYHYATPVSQVVELRDIYMEYTNRDTKAQSDIMAKVDITDPDGLVTTLTAPINQLDASQTARVWFPPYKPVKKIGKFIATFSNNKYTEPRDTLIRVFCHTPYTYATDNLTLEPGGVGPYDPSIDPPDWVIQNASLYRTGPNGGEATYASFGIANPDSVYVPNLDPFGNAIVALLYDADKNRDGVNDFANSFADLETNIVAIAYLFLDGTQPADSILHLPLQDFWDPTIFGAKLKPDHPYYLSLIYDGQMAGTGRFPKFSKTSDEFYVHNLATPLCIGQLFPNGWFNAEVITRLQLKGFSPHPVGTKVPLLDQSKVTIAPNPAHETARISIRLDAISPTVRVQVLDLTGRVVRTATQHHFQQGTFDFDVRDLPTGTYLVAIATAEGGFLGKMVVGQ